MALLPGPLRRILGLGAGHDQPSCAACATPTISVVTAVGYAGRFMRLIRVRMLHRQYLSAWCAHCHLARGDREDWVWWLPEPVTDLAWSAIDDLIPDMPPGCCGCGGWRGPTRYAVWGDDDGPDGAETYCGPCVTDPMPGHGRWYPGCTSRPRRLLHGRGLAAAVRRRVVRPSAHQAGGVMPVWLVCAIWIIWAACGALLAVVAVGLWVLRPGPRRPGRGRRAA